MVLVKACRIMSMYVIIETNQENDISRLQLNFPEKTLVFPAGGLAVKSCTKINYCIPCLKKCLNLKRQFKRDLKGTILIT
jgi:hypothetical protein